MKFGKMPLNVKALSGLSLVDQQKLNLLTGIAFMHKHTKATF